MYQYDEDENKVYLIVNGTSHPFLDCNFVEEDFKLNACASKALEHLKLSSLDEYVEMVSNGYLEEYLKSHNQYQTNLENTIARQIAESEKRAITPMDEWMAHLTATELMDS